MNILIAFAALVPVAFAEDLTLSIAAPRVPATQLDYMVAALVPATDTPRSDPIPANIEQVNAQFEPFIRIVQTGAWISFPNRDDFAHHVYSFADAMRFELTLYDAAQSKQVQALQTGIVPLGCNIHDWMLGYIVVVDTPHYALLNNAQASFSDLAPGDYELLLWHPSMRDFWRQAVSIAPGQRTLAVRYDGKLRRVTPPERNWLAGGDDY